MNKKDINRALLISVLFIEILYRAAQQMATLSVASVNDTDFTLSFLL